MITDDRNKKTRKTVDTERETKLEVPVGSVKSTFEIRGKGKRLCVL